ncbi:MAG: histidinol-phosphate transaminase [Planctomycetes bacterium]|nr:histidinol-phosphate transaminase [Planctomycetota bacterium]
MKQNILKHIHEMDGYVPGEQPQTADYVKLNTNENPYPPSTAVYEAVACELERLRLYPQPMSDPLRDAAVEVYGFEREWVLAGNGSDDLLRMFAQVFLSEGQAACAPVPTYTLYRTLAAMQNSRVIEVPFEEGYRLPVERLCTSGGALLFLANPNSPTGTMAGSGEVSELAGRFPGYVLIDEAYADFADENCLELVRRHPNVGVLRTFSKSYALAGLRVGLLFARPEMTAEITKVKDSYNLDRLAIAGAAAALRDREHFERIRALVLGTRRRLAAALQERGFSVLPSQSNFVMASPPEGLGAGEMYGKLKERRILVRYFERELPEYLRITVGKDTEIDALLAGIDEITEGG